MARTVKTNFAIVLLLWGAGLGAAAQYGKVSVIFEEIGTLYPDAGIALGFTVSLVGLVGILLGVAAGILVGRIGFRRALVGGLVMGACVSAYQATLPPLPLFLASRIPEGLSHLALVVSAPTLIALISSDAHRGFTLTLWGTFFGVAYTALVWLGRPLVEGYGVPALFWAHAIYMAVFAAIMWHALSPDSTRPNQDLGLADLMRQHLAIYRSPHLSAPALGWLFYTLSFVSILTLLPTFLDPEVRALIIGAMPLISIASSLVLGVWLLRWLSAVRVMQIGFVSAAAFACGLALVPGHPLVCLALAAALGLVQGAGFAAVPELNPDPEARAQANGALAQTGNIGNTLGTPLLLAVIGFAGHTGFMLAAAGLLTFGALGQVWLSRRRTQRAITPEP